MLLFHQLPNLLELSSFMYSLNSKLFHLPIYKYFNKYRVIFSCKKPTVKQPLKNRQNKGLYCVTMINHFKGGHAQIQFWSNFERISSDKAGYFPKQDIHFILL